MESFRDLFYKHDGRLVNKWDHYFEIYDRHFSKFRGKNINLLEIGISHGGSLQLWKKYFGEEVKIYAIDVNPECKKFEDDQVKIFIGSQSNPDFLRTVVKDIPKLDIIIDDGGHTMKQQIVSFEVLFKNLLPDGVYLCEDTHTSYWYEYGGGLHKKGTFVEYAKSLIDYINAWYVNYSRTVQPNDVTKNVNSIHFYDSIIVFDKTSDRNPPFSIMRGNETIQHFDEPEYRKKTFFIDLIFFFKRLVYKISCKKTF
jgi:hypothetical protein